MYNTNTNTTNNNNSPKTAMLPPSRFLCPLTLELMSDPLVSIHGHSFERKAIMEWIHRGNDTCPLTRKPLTMNKLIANSKLKVQIHQWKIRHDVVTSDEGSSSSSSSSEFGLASNPSSSSLKKQSAYSSDDDKYDVNEATQCMENLGLMMPTQQQERMVIDANTILSNIHHEEVADNQRQQRRRRPLNGLRNMLIGRSSTRS